MKRRKWIAFLAVLILLLPMPLSAKNSVEIMTTVPENCTIKIVADINGTYRVAGKEYSGQSSFTVKRFQNMEVEAIPNQGYIPKVTVGGKELRPSDENIFTLTNVCSNDTMRIEFISDTGNGVSLVAPENSVIGQGTNKTLMVQVFGDKILEYLWEVSNDGGKKWAAVSGINNKASYEITNAQVNPNGANVEYIYRLTVTDSKNNKSFCTCKVLVMDNYQYRKVSYTENMISVTTYMHDNTHLEITYINESNASTIMSNLDENQIPLFICDVSLVNNDGKVLPHFGELMLEFYVGDTFNGQTLRVFHLHEGEEVKTHIGYVENGYLTIIADSLSIFAVEAPKDFVYEVSVNSGNHGEISPAGVVYVGKDSNLLLSFKPMLGYRVSQLVINDVVTDVSRNHYLLENVKGDSFVEVTFARNKWDHVFWISLLTVLIGSLHMAGAITKKRKRRKEMAVDQSK